MDTVFIYTLNCPMTGAIRYVGYTKNSAKRHAEHLRSRKKNHNGNWIRSLRADGWEPIMERLDETTSEFAGPLEAAYIQFFREEGCDLVNSTSGGEGVEMTPETRAKMTGRVFSEEHRAKLSAASLGRKLSLEHCAKLRAINLGKKYCLGRAQSAEHRANQSAARKGIPLSEEHCANISAGMLGPKNHNFGKSKSIETKLKISASLTDKKHSAERCANTSAVMRLWWKKRKE